MNARRTALVLVAALSLAGCGDAEMRELRSYIDEVKARPPGPLKPLPEIPQVDTFVYEPRARRDPFVMDARSAQALTARVDTGIAPDPLRRKEELEQYSLDSLKMVGTLERDDDRWGLVLTPEGILHRVQVGNYLGTNNGQIIRISPDEIQLTEIVGNGQGSWQERQAAIALSQ